MPLLRPGTFSISSGSPASDSRVNRPRVSRWISTSRPTMYFANLGSQGWRPSRIAIQRIGFMGGA